jgi:hypothetical protein
VVERYLSERAGHKGTKAARSQYDACLNIVARAAWRHPEDIKAAYPKASILEAGKSGLQYQGQPLPIDRPRAVSGGRRRDPVLWNACRV